MHFGECRHASKISVRVYLLHGVCVDEVVGIYVNICMELDSTKLSKLNVTDSVCTETHTQPAALAKVPFP